MIPQEQPDSQGKTLLDDWEPIFVNGVIPTEFREWCRKQWIGNVMPDSQAGDERKKALMANYPGTSASPQFLDDCMMFVTAYAATVEREAAVAVLQGLDIYGRWKKADELPAEIKRRLAALQGPQEQ